MIQARGIGRRHIRWRGGCQCGPRCFRVRIGAQGHDGVEQFAAMPDETNAQLLQVLHCQVQEDSFVNLVLAKCRLIAFEA